jgi:hypothetical protein
MSATIEQKFENFKTLIKSIPGVSTLYLTAINQISLSLFLTGIKHELNQGKNKAELIQSVVEKTGIEFDSLEKDIKIKLDRYIDLFIKLVELG